MYFIALHVFNVLETCRPYKLMINLEIVKFFKNIISRFQNYHHMVWPHYISRNYLVIVQFHVRYALVTGFSIEFCTAVAVVVTSVTLIYMAEGCVTWAHRAQAARGVEQHLL